MDRDSFGVLLDFCDLPTLAQAARVCREWHDNTRHYRSRVVPELDVIAQVYHTRTFDIEWWQIAWKRNDYQDALLTAWVNAHTCTNTGEYAIASFPPFSNHYHTIPNDADVFKPIPPWSHVRRCLFCPWYQPCLHTRPTRIWWGNCWGVEMCSYVGFEPLWPRLVRLLEFLRLPTARADRSTACWSALLRHTTRQLRRSAWPTLRKVGRALAPALVLWGTQLVRSAIGVSAAASLASPEHAAVLGDWVLARGVHDVLAPF